MSTSLYLVIFPLEVAVRRRLAIYDGYLNGSYEREFGEWSLAVPSISTYVLYNSHWNGANRCTAPLDSSIDSHNPNEGSITLRANHFSGGLLLDVPGQGRAQVYQVDPDANPFPGEAVWMTTEGWYFTCGQTSIPSGGSSEQAFIGHAPNGDTYHFDVVHMARPDKQIEMAKKPRRWMSVTEFRQYSLRASKVIDKDGNEVNYIYNAVGRLESIAASDGRSIDFRYERIPGFESHKITEVIANDDSSEERRWTYDYGNPTTIQRYYVSPPSEPYEYRIEWFSHATLTQVNLPDGRHWAFDMLSMGAKPITGGSVDGQRCEQPPQSVTIDHPDGTVGRFDLKQGANMVEPLPLWSYIGPFTTSCLGNPDDLSLATVPPWIAQWMLLTEKVLTQPNGDSDTWLFSLGYLNSEKNLGTSVGWEPKNSVTNPDGSIKVVTYLSVDPLEYVQGVVAPVPLTPLVDKEEIFDASDLTTPIQTTQYEYRHSGTRGLRRPYSGSGRNPWERFDVSSRVQNVRSKVTLTRDGSSYVTTNTHNTSPSSVDFSWGLPTRVEKTSDVVADTRVTDVTYRTPTAASWILGLPDVVTSNGVELVDFAYTSAGNVSSIERFGKPHKTYTYHTVVGARGALRTSTDAIGRQTLYDTYHRGIPRLIRRPDNTELRLLVDDLGQVERVTDAMGAVVNYEYNLSGWLANIDRPGALATTSIDYFQRGSADFHQRATTGNHQAHTYYDGYLRPWKTRLIDTTRPDTRTYTLTTYDGLGRPDFEMAPDAVAGTSNFGVRTVYDALGRVIETRENKAPFATTRYSYLTGNRVRITDPEGNITTTTRSGYGHPDDGEVVLIEQPEGVTTQMTYDVWGKMIAARQWGASNGFNADYTQQYAYNSKFELCRHYTPETNSTLFYYDAAGQLMAKREGYAGFGGCVGLASPEQNYDDVRAENPAWHFYQYDEMGRLTHTDFRGSTPSIERDYDDNGNITFVRRGTTQWDYSYIYGGDTDYLETESLTIDGRTFTTSYERDSLGNIISQTYPSGRTVYVTSNALGQATEARVSGSIPYADAMTYHPGGLLAGMDLGNGHSFNRQLNERKLVERATYSSVVDRSYLYDGNARVTQVTDAASSAANRGFTYDGLGRLTAATGPWGSASYLYDAVGNIREKALGARTVSLEYDTATNRIHRVRDDAEWWDWRVFSHDERGNVTSTGTNVADGSAATAVDVIYDTANQPIEMSNPAGMGGGTPTGHELLERGIGAFTSLFTGPPESGGPAPMTIIGGVGSIALDDSSSRRAFLRDALPLIAGQTYTLKVEARVVGTVSEWPSDNDNVEFSVYLLDGGYNAIRHLKPRRGETYIFPADGWVELDLRFTAAAGDVYVRPRIGKGMDFEGNGAVEFRNLRVEGLFANGGPTGDPHTFAYDGNLKRAKQLMDGELVYSVYNLDGMLVHRHNVITNEVTDYVSAGGSSIVRIKNGVPTYTYTDHLGSQTVLADEVGGVVLREELTPYGEVFSSTSAANDNEPVFTGHVRDTATGLTYMLARYYDPVIGRFLATDPVQFSPDRPGMFSRYAYAENDPTNMTDPDGRVARVAISAFKIARRTIKARGNIVKAVKDEIGDIVDAAETLADPSASGLEKAGAVVSLATGINLRGAKKGRGAQVGGSIDPKGSTRASDIEAKASEVGFTRTQTKTGPVKFKDENGVDRVTIKSGSPRTPGSEGAHVELRRSDGQRVNVFGRPVTRKDPENHTPIVDDRQ
ncbi:MAG: RHS repeat-associated core domain-containing protein [Pseudomonadota bacterium]